MCSNAVSYGRLLIQMIGARVYQQTHFPTNSVEELSCLVNERFKNIGTKTHLLCNKTALLVIWSGVDIPNDTSPDEIRRHSELVNPVARFLGEFYDQSRRPSQRYDPIVMWIPCWNYLLEMCLPPGETNGKYIAVGTQVQSGILAPLRCEIVWKGRAKASRSTQVITVLKSWFCHARNFGVANERLETAKDLVVEQNGSNVFFTIPDYSPVTFPWVELYLQLRSSLQRRDWPSGILFKSPC
jgi:hypothetical protein